MKNENASPWRERFGWFWYNDFEIFEASDAELEAGILRFKDQGINHLITFSCTHFRWNFMDSWNAIHSCLKRLCQLAHKHGMRVTEHHSCHLTFHPVDEDSQNYMLKGLQRRHSDPAHWPGLMENATGEPLINGQPLSGFRQIDGSTGKAVYTMYKGHAMCFNNPHYVSEYLKYLEQVYDCGVDGIMTDDVQYFGESCACQYCQEKFKKYSGFELPAPGDAWKRWFGNYADESFVKWLEFRSDSLTGFHGKVKEHYESLGLKLFRPWYRSHSLSHSLLNYYLEPLPALDWIFQEACYSSIIRYSWVNWALEQKHRVSVARQRGIPPMVMFYPERQDQMDFSWALCRSWASMYLATFEGKTGNCTEKNLRKIEQDYADFLDDLDCVAKIAFYDTYHNRLKNNQFNLSRMKSWMQSCILSNIPCDLFSDHEFSRMDNYAVVCAVDHGLMSEFEANKLLEFAASGATLMISESSGIFDENMHVISRKRWLQRWKIAAVPRNHDYEAIPCGQGRIVIISDEFMRLTPSLECWAQRFACDSTPQACPNDFKQAQKEIADFKAFISRMCPEAIMLRLTGFQHEFSATLHKNRSGVLVLQLVNSGGTQALPENGTISHSDPIPFPEAGHGVVVVGVEQRQIKSVKMVALHGKKEHNLEFSQSNGNLSIIVPAQIFQCYALIMIR